jgi:hypothetical protein
MTAPPKLAAPWIQGDVASPHGFFYSFISRFGICSAMGMYKEKAEYCAANYILVLGEVIIISFRCKEKKNAFRSSPWGK